MRQEDAVERSELPEVIAARLKQFDRTHDARHLWPDVSVEAFRSAQRELGRAFSAVLGGGVEPVVLRLPPHITARALGIVASAEGMGPLLGYWCETGRLIASPAVAEILALHLDHGRRRTARVRQGLERVLVALSDRGIGVIALKGIHTAYTHFPEPGTRPPGDIDLLVQPEDWHTALDVLRDAGFTEGLTDHPQPERSVWIPPDPSAITTLEYAHENRPWSIDLHRSLDRTPFEGLTTTLGTPATSAAVAWLGFSKPLYFLPQPLLLAYLALHASSHFYSMRQLSLVELILVVQRDFVNHAERWRAFDELIARTETARFVFPALSLADRCVPRVVDQGVLTHLAHSAPRLLRTLVRRTEPACAQRLHPIPGLRERFVWVSSPREVAAALSWFAWPRGPGGRAAFAIQWGRIKRAAYRIAQNTATTLVQLLAGEAKPPG